eukprot:364948-Chlamydomonas_euryale.AAC.18
MAAAAVLVRGMAAPTEARLTNSPHPRMIAVPLCTTTTRRRHLSVQKRMHVRLRCLRRRASPQLVAACVAAPRAAPRIQSAPSCTGRPGASSTPAAAPLPRRAARAASAGPTTPMRWWSAAQHPATRPPPRSTCAAGGPAEHEAGRQ